MMTAKTLDVTSSMHTYRITIASSAACQTELLATLKKLACTHVVVISDDNVSKTHAAALMDLLKTQHENAILLSFAPGEQQKTRQTKEHLEDTMLAQGCARDTVIIALGGGIVTDMAGFVAATYCRGIPIIQCPTSLLAMVDASIGGKTGVNTQQGKNLIGSFYQPSAVIINTDYCQTLPEKELLQGISETIKHGLIANPTLCKQLQNDVHAILNKDSALLQSLIHESCAIKKTIVEQDEKEHGLRSVLNFGHTIGHGLEMATQHSLAHGEAVAIGMLVESYMSQQLGLLSQNDFSTIQDLLTTYPFPLYLPDHFSLTTFQQALTLDKKARENKVRFVLLRAIGQPYVNGQMYTHPVPDTILTQATNWMQQLAHT